MRKRKSGADAIRIMDVKRKRNFYRRRGIEDVDGHLDIKYEFPSVLEKCDDFKPLLKEVLPDINTKQEIDNFSFLENDNIIIIVTDEYMPESGLFVSGGVEIGNDMFEDKVVSKLEDLFREQGKSNRCRKKKVKKHDLIERPGINYKYGKKSGTFLCHICGKLVTTLNTITFRNHLKRHEAMEANLRNYKCLVCEKTFNLNSSMRMHYLKVHDKEKLESRMHHCPVCGEKSLSREHILACEASHNYLEPPTPFQCHCGEAFISRYKLVVHRNNKHRKKGKKELSSVKWCKPCSQDFFSATEFAEHKREVHGYQTYECPMCDCELTTTFSLDLHLKKLHSISNPSNVKTIRCHDCDTFFAKFASFVRHTREFHGREVGAVEILEINEEIRVKEEVSIRVKEEGVIRVKEEGVMVDESEETPVRVKAKWICPLCPKELASPYSLNSHLETIHKLRKLSATKSILCGVCGKEFNTLGLYIHHKAKVHGEEISAAELEELDTVLSEADPSGSEIRCPACGQLFKNKKALYNHEYNNHRQPKLVTCNVCHLTFESRKSCVDHKFEVHTPEEQKVCRQCGKRFSTYGGLWSHKYVHASSTFPCIQCGSIFKRKGDYSRHLKEKHGVLLEA